MMDTFEKFDASKCMERIEKKHQEFLKAVGDFIKKHPVCPIKFEDKYMMKCKPSNLCNIKGGFFGLIDFKGFTFDCPHKNPGCYASKREIAYREFQIDKILRNIGIPEENIHFDLRDKTDLMSLACKEYAKLFGQGKCLRLIAKTGTGKSSRASGVCREYIRKQLLEGMTENDIVKPVWAYVPEIIESYNGRYQNYDSWKMMINKLNSSSFLVIDDLGMGKAEIENEIFSPVICQRADKRKSTIITMQLSGADFENRFGARTASRLAGKNFKGIFYNATGKEKNYRET